MKHGQKKTDEWFPFYIDKWLFGSTRYELEPAEQSVWIDLLVLSKKDDGFIRANETTPYPIQQLAGFFNKPEALIRATIKKLLDPKVKKLVETSPGIYYAPSQEAYELSERQKRRIKAAKKDEAAGKADAMSGKADIAAGKADARIEEKRGEENRGDKKDDAPSFSADQEKKIFKAALEVFDVHEVDKRILPAIRALQAEFRLRDPVEAFKKKVAWWRDKPAKLRGNVTLQLRNWWRIEADMEKGDSVALNVGRNVEPGDERTILYKNERRKKIADMMKGRAGELADAQLRQDAKAIEKIELEMKEELAAWSREWHEKHGKEET